MVAGAAMAAVAAVATMVDAAEPAAVEAVARPPRQLSERLWRRRINLSEMSKFLARVVCFE